MRLTTLSSQIFIKLKPSYPQLELAESIRFCFKNIAHSKDITHCIFQSDIRFEIGSVLMSGLPFHVIFFLKFQKIL